MADISFVSDTFPPKLKPWRAVAFWNRLFETVVILYPSANLTTLSVLLFANAYSPIVSIVSPSDT